MVDSGKYGSIWTDIELDLIVADYFAMLADDLSGRPYIKARHNEVLARRLGRSRGSVEFKYQNISAVLDKLGSPWIPGYKPAAHYQGVIAEAIGRYLSHAPEAIDPPPPVVAIVPDTEVFVPPPLPRPQQPVPDSLQHLIGKFDPLERDRRNRALGRAGEQFVLEVERRRLIDIGRSDLARQVRWVAEEDGDGAGYDVLSYGPTGGECLLEVKTTNGSAYTPFFVTRNEFALSTIRPEEWRIFRVHMFAKSPRIFTIVPPLETSIRLETEIWRASL